MHRFALRFFLIFVFFCSQSLCVVGQTGFFLPKGKDKVTIPFEYVNHFIILTLNYQGVFPLKFIFDTGAEHTILTKKEVAALFKMEYDRTFKVYGSDMKTEMTAYLVRRVPFTIENKTEAPYQDILVMDEDYFKFDEHIGMTIHGILSAKAFSRYLIHINYDRSSITLVNPEKAERYTKQFEEIPMSLHRNKPYIESQLHLQQDSTLQVRLLLDTGAALSLMVFDNTHPNLHPPAAAIRGNIGMGLGGFLEGYTGRVEALGLNENLEQRQLISYFQVLDTVGKTDYLHHRNGLVGNVVLERFHLVLDYQLQKIYLKKGKKYKNDYKFDRSGLHIVASGPNLNKYLVQYVLPDSPAAEADFQPGDCILSLNRIPVKMMSLTGIGKRFQKKEGKKVRVRFERGGKKMVKTIVLRKLV